MSRIAEALLFSRQTHLETKDRLVTGRPAAPLDERQKQLLVFAPGERLTLALRENLNSGRTGGRAQMEMAALFPDFPGRRAFAVEEPI